MFKNFIFLIFILFFCKVETAELVKANLEVKFNNKDWFPLTLEEMEKASVDTALAEITRSGVFQLGKKNKRDSNVKNRVFVEVSLVEAASSVKVTIRITSQNKPEVIATSSGSIINKKYQGIFKVFESVGRKAGKKAYG